jgi:hypothetical protein
MTSGELAILGLSSTNSLPTGQSLRLTVCCGTGTAKRWSDALAPVFKDKYGATLESGTFNLRSGHEIKWVDPCTVRAADLDWELCPLVLAGQAVGVAIRANRFTPRLLEVVSPVNLRNTLGYLRDGDTVEAVILSGKHLCRAI